MDVALYEVKNKLSSYIDEVVKGREITITRHGKPVARLMPPVDRFDRVKVAKAVDALLELGKGASLGGLSVRDLKNMGRA